MTPVAVDVNDVAAVGESLAGAAADAVVLTVRTFPADEEFLVAATRTVLDAAARLGIRVLVVGGAGALRSPGTPDLPVADNPVYVPAEYRDVAAVGIAQLRTCGAHSGADWVYLSPPALWNPASAPAGTGAARTPCCSARTGNPASVPRTWQLPYWTNSKARVSCGTSRWCSSTRKGRAMVVVQGHEVVP
ncbi:hypothetical protein MBT84_37300 [Streptomyces sp. MBT84]|nr:hypothetical protein [Streptomyces sp. MBT84]